MDWPEKWTEVYTSLSVCTPGQTVSYAHGSSSVLESSSTSTCTLTATHIGAPVYDSNGRGGYGRHAHSTLSSRSCKASVSYKLGYVEPLSIASGTVDWEQARPFKICESQSRAEPEQFCSQRQLIVRGELNFALAAQQRQLVFN